MTKRILIVQGHPDPAGGRLCHALADAYASGAAEAGHAVVRVEVAGLDFPMLRDKESFYNGEIPDALKAASAAIFEAEHIVIVFPLWLGTMPALLKAFLEQVMRPNVAFAYRKSGFPEKRLAGRSARLVVTMGMPALVYRWFFGAHALKGMERNILNFVGIRPVRESFFGNVEGADAARRAGWIRAMRDLGRRAA